MFVDPIASQEVVTDREAVCKVLLRNTLLVDIELAQVLDSVHNDVATMGVRVSSPKWMIFQEVDGLPNQDAILRNGLRFPIMCKSTLACGNSSSHQMGLLCNEAGVSVSSDSSHVS